MALFTQEKFERRHQKSFFFNLAESYVVYKKSVITKASLTVVMNVENAEL